MHTLFWAVAAFPVAFLVLMTVEFVYAALHVVYQYASDVRRKGYLPPPPDPKFIKHGALAARFLNWWLVGKRQVYGLENLDKIPAGAAYTITPNHSHFCDVFVFFELLAARKLRYMSAGSVMSILGLLFAPYGAFMASRKAAVEALVTGQPLLLYPEGWAYMDGKMGKLAKGAVVISKQAAEQMGKPTYIVPVHVRYGRYPGSWIRKININLQFLVLLLCYFYFRRGVLIVIGEPIASTSLPTDNTVATELLSEQIRRLDPQLC